MLKNKGVYTSNTHGGLKHLKVKNKHVRRYMGILLIQITVSLIFVRLTCVVFHIVLENSTFALWQMMVPVYVPKFACQSVGRNCFASIVPDMCKAVDIKGQKTGHSGKVTCAILLY